MSKGERRILCAFALGVTAAGVWLMLDELGWKALAGLSLILWGNNISQSKAE